MSESIKFINRKPPNWNESTADWFFRLAFINYHKADYALRYLSKKILGYEINLQELVFLDDPGVFDFLASLVLLEGRELADTPLSTFAHILSSQSAQDVEGETPLSSDWKGYFDQQLNFCPLCLEEVFYIRKHWHMIFVGCCTVHNTWLCHKCLNCGKAWTMHDLFENRCSACAAQATAYVDRLRIYDSNILNSQVILLRLLGLDSSFTVPSMLSNAGEKVLFSLLNGIAQVVSKLPVESSIRLETNVNLDDLDVCSTKRVSAVLDHATAYEAITDWPHSFYNFLDRYRARFGNKKQRGLQHEFGALYLTWLLKRWNSSEFAFVHETFSEYVKLKFIPYSNLKQAKLILDGPKLLQESDFVTVDEAAELLNMNLITILNFISSGQLKLFRSDNGPIEYVKKADLEKLK